MKPKYNNFEQYIKDYLPEDFFCGLYILDKNLLVIYQRSILIIKNAVDGPPQEPETFIEMQDYYSYEPPQIVRDHRGRIWCNIGGRMFFKQNVDDKWTETQGFHIGDAPPLVTDKGLIVFSTNYQHDTQTEGVILFDPETAKASFFPVKGMGKSPIPSRQLPDGQLEITNATTLEHKLLDISTV